MNSSDKMVISVIIILYIIIDIIKITKLESFGNINLKEMHNHETCACE